jgi:DNA repair exonuclease SbcCD ATPase subunit
LIATKTTLIVGKNGSGKSTLLDALMFALYGKPFRNINKPMVINSQNGRDCVVEVEFKINKTEYKIIRGMKPNIFEIWANDKLIDQHTSVGEYQDYLENFILKVNEKTFRNIILLGNASFKPFMQLPPAHRREIIEDLLDIQIFSTMNTIAKQKLQNNREELEKTRIKTVTLQNSIAMLNKTIADLEKVDTTMEGEKQKRIADLKKDISHYYDEVARVEKLEPEINELQKQLKDAKKKVYNYQYMHSQIKVNLEKHNHNHEFYGNNDTCPTCTQAIEKIFKEKMIQEASEKIEEYSTGLEKIVIKIDEMKQNEKEIDTRLSDLLSEYRQKDWFLENINAEESELERLTNPEKVEDISTVLSSTKENLVNVTAELADIEKERTRLLEERQYLELTLSLLKDGGIKTKIIKQYLPVINKYINKFLGAMDFYVSFELNENFEESIKSRFRDDFLYDSFSEGEKMRINLAILFTWRAISKLKNSISTNLLIMDEIFESSLDGEGTDEFMKIINGLTTESNTIIISHKRDQISDKFDRMIKFEKIKDYSRIVE